MWQGLRRRVQWRVSSRRSHAVAEARALIGGPPGSGKTTIANRIARRHGLRWYTADTQTWAHHDRTLREGQPAELRWEAMTPDERWTNATPAEMFEMSLNSERGPRSSRTSGGCRRRR